jgi:hypothetical protein
LFIGNISYTLQNTKVTIQNFILPNGRHSA